MPIKRITFCATLVLVSVLLASPTNAQGTRADYERAWSLKDRFQDKVVRARVDSNWISESQFWYRVGLGDGKREYVLVDAESGVRELAFDHQQFAAALQAATGKEQDASRLEIGKILLAEPAQLHVNSAGKWWEIDNLRGKLVLAKLETAPEDSASKTLELSPRRSPLLDRRTRESPDRRWEVRLKNKELWLLDRETDEEYKKASAPDGAARFEAEVHWSPDSQRFVAVQVTPGARRQVHLIESSPRDRVQPKHHTLSYLKPGDQIQQQRLRLFPVRDAAEIELDDSLFAQPWSINRLHWRANSDAFHFLYNQRGHQVLRVVRVDAATGKARAVIDEQSDTFIDYAGKLFLHYVDATDELLWMSERDGWNHLYLYDAHSGKVKNQVTRGPWVVRSVDHVDEGKRHIWFRAGGIYGEQDPYYIHYCRVDFDGKNFVRLTNSDGTHEVSYSPTRRYLVDQYSRVDLPPVTELRSAIDGSLVCELERGDATRLVEAGWRAPERFVAKGRDGKSDVYGVIYRPTDFDPVRKYPVVEEHYAGPHSAHCPKAFATLHRSQAEADLGFIVVQLDGMGTSHRSKAFHDVCWKNLVDGGFPDRIAWLRAAAEHEPAMDLTRVGVRGTSAGGQTGLAAMLHHGDFYKACVSNCGCHDNRMDKIWWNELWMGWPVKDHYEAQSNVTNARNLRGDLLLIVGEMDRNVPPTSTLQVVDALIRADKDFELLYVPGAGHGAGGAYTRRRTWDFFVRTLHGVEPRSE